jgi:hypothetical protein
MPQVHLSGARFRVRASAVASAVQAYTGATTKEARHVASCVVDGKPVSVHLDDIDAAYNLAAELAGLGVNAEPDEGDY